MVKGVLSSNFELRKIQLATITGAIIYIVSLIDVIVDVMSILGFTNDT